MGDGMLHVSAAQSALEAAGGHMPSLSVTITGAGTPVSHCCCAGSWPAGAWPSPWPGASRPVANPVPGYRACATCRAVGHDRARPLRPGPAKPPPVACHPPPGRYTVRAGWAFRERKRRCTLIVLWMLDRESPWVVLTDESSDDVDLGACGTRVWIEQGFRTPGAWAGNGAAPAAWTPSAWSGTGWCWPWSPSGCRPTARAWRRRTCAARPPAACTHRPRQPCPACDRPVSSSWSWFGSSGCWPEGMPGAGSGCNPCPVPIHPRICNGSLRYRTGNIRSPLDQGNIFTYPCQVLRGGLVRHLLLWGGQLPLVCCEWAHQGVVRLAPPVPALVEHVMECWNDLVRCVRDPSVPSGTNRPGAGLAASSPGRGWPAA